MTEKEKMLNGYLYDPFSEDMPEERRRCHELCQQYNLVPESNYQKREELLNRRTLYIKPRGMQEQNTKNRQKTFGKTAATSAGCCVYKCETTMKGVRNDGT